MVPLLAVGPAVGLRRLVLIVRGGVGDAGSLRQRQPGMLGGQQLPDELRLEGVLVGSPYEEGP